MSARLTRLLLVLSASAALCGCSISHTIVDVEPPPQPSLVNLESNLTYRDPDDGRPDYIFYQD